MTTEATIDLLKKGYIADSFHFAFNCSMLLAGDSNKKLRRAIALHLGHDLPQSKCGLTNVSAMIKASIEQGKLF